MMTCCVLPNIRVMNEYEIKEYVEDNVDPYHSQNMYQNGNPGILLHLQLVNVP